jgi:TonB-linked SusC/RagA family outer membrane protein
LISVILDDLFKGTDVKYTIVDRKIILAPEYLTKTAGLQQKQTTGRITDENGNPLPGVNIQIEGTIVGVISDIDGKYAILIPSDDAVLSFSFIGYKTQKVSVSGRTVIDVALVPDLATLDEVVVVGYGTVKKSDLTGSVGSVSSEKLVSFPTTDALQALQGKVAGLNITSNNGAPGAPGKYTTIRIRGGSSITAGSEPLWVVDGFPGAPEPPAEDIKSIEVLRDASSTAIFGSRGSNGVILVTTKKGISGGLKVDLNTSYSITKVTKQYDVLNGVGYANFANDYTLTKSPSAALKFADPNSVGQGTNWQDLVFRTGALQIHQVSVAGGSDFIKVYSSVRYAKNSGIVINSNNENLAGRLNLDATVSKNATLGAHLDFSHNTTNNVSSQTWYTGSGGITGTALVFEPWLGIYDANGNYTTSVYAYASDNPYANAVERKNQNVDDNFTSNMYLDDNLFAGLKFYTSLAIGFASGRNGSYVPSTLVRNTSIGVAQMSTNRNINLNSTTYLTFNKTLADIHHFTLMAGHDYQKNNYEYFMGQSKGFPTDAFSYWGLGYGSTALTPTSNTNKWVMEAVYSRFNYNLNDKYLLTLTGRYDGSSRLGSNNKWAFFPSAAARWNMKKEAVLQSIDAISDLSLHAGYGSVGNTNIAAYSSLAGLTGDGIFRFVNGSRVNAIIPSSVENANLSWETNTMSNIGVDLSLFKARLKFSAEYYNNETVNMLYYVPLPLYSGYPGMMQNFGEFRNRGVEFTFGTNLTHGDFYWETDFNISSNKSTVIKLPGGDVHNGNSPLNNAQPFLLREGESTNSFYGYVYQGVYQTGDDFSAEPLKKPGYAKYADINGRDANGNLTGEPDGTINSDDQKIIGTANPKFTFGWVNSLSFKNFDLNIQMTGSYGNKMINCTRMELESMADLKNTTTAYYSAWTPTHTNTNVPLVGSESQYIYSTRWLEDASFLRAQNITVGFSLPSSLLKTLKISKFRIYVGVQNAFILTKYSGYDPEVIWNPSGSITNSNICRGLDYDSYPRTRNYSAGLNITF